MLENSDERKIVKDSAQEKTTSENYIVLQEPSSKKRSVRYLCTLCNASLSGEQSKHSHIKGKKHVNNLSKKQTLEKKEKRKKEKLEAISKKASEYITAINAQSSNKISSINTIGVNIPGFEIIPNFANEKLFESNTEMASVNKTVKSLSLKRGSTFHSKNQDNSFVSRTDGFIPIVKTRTFHQNLRAQGNRWNHNNSWNSNVGYYGYHDDRSYYDSQDRSYHQYQGEDQQQYQNNSYGNAFPEGKQSNGRNNWKKRYFSKPVPNAIHFDVTKPPPNYNFNVDKHEESNAQNVKEYVQEQLDSIVHSSRNNFCTKDKPGNDSTESMIPANLNEHSNSTMLNSSQNCSSSKVISVSRSHPANVDSPRRLRSSKRVKNNQQSRWDKAPVVSSNNNVEIENSNDADKQQDKRLPSENMSDRISHWLNPLNSRDKAEINKLMNNYSKSKKKETLLKLKLRSEDKNIVINNENNENLFQNLEELTDKINAAESELEQSSNNLDPSHSLNASSDNLISSGSVDKVSSPKRKRRKKSNLSESSCNSLDVDSNSRAKSSVCKDIDSAKKKNVRKSRASTDSSISTLKTMEPMDFEAQLDELMLGKRRSSLSLSNKSKKHKCSGSECAIECAYEKGSSEESPSLRDNANSDICDTIVSVLIKEESCPLSSQNCNPSETSQKETFNLSMVENAKIVDVDDLMKMFALENVTIKKEFDDPLIEAIKNVDVNFLMNVCDPATESANTSSSTNPSPCVPSLEKNCDNQPDKGISNAPSPHINSSSVSTQLQTETNTSNEQFNASVSEISPQLQSVCDAQVNNSLASAPATQKQSTANVCEMLSSGPENAHPPSISNKAGVNKSSKQFDTFESAFPGLSPFKVYVNISNELNKLQKEEEEKRNLLKEVDKMLEEHQKILNDLTARKIKLQIEEDNLINRRKTLTCALSQCVISDSYAVTADKNQPSEEVKEEIRPVGSTLVQVVNQLAEIADIQTLCNVSGISSPSVSNVNETNSAASCNLEPQKETTYESPQNQSEPVDNEKPKSKEVETEDNEDIIIIPAEKKIVPVIDLVDSESPIKSKDQNKPNFAQNFSDLTVHKSVVNSVKVHDGYLYTCSNDYTAKRFNLKDPTNTVSYQHARRNVIQLCIETYSDDTLLFTLCSTDNRVSSFRAEDGILLKCYSLESICAGISNGWGKVYAGLKTGLIVTCSRKDSKDLVRNLEPVKSLACTMQGGLRVIIILSMSGQVAVRDVERNGLLIRYIKAHNDTPLFMNVYNDYVYLSSSVLLTATNLSTGNVERKIKLTSPITGLAAFESNIFTTAFTGLVRCYHEGKMLNMKMAYGAGHESLTCIYVYQGWVFTGNRNGVVSVFHFNPSNEYQCQVSNCKNIYMHTEDLNRHVNINSDHKLLSKSVKCPWRKCQQAFNKEWNEEARKCHLKSHVKNLSSIL